MSERIYYWIPRSLAIFSLMFMLIFSFDVFDGPETVWNKLLGFVVSNIPVIILIAVLIIAWKWEVAGGVLYIVASVAAMIYFNAFKGNPWSLVVILPFLITGILFILQRVIYSRPKDSEV